MTKKIEPGTLCIIQAPGYPSHGWFVTAQERIGATGPTFVWDGETWSIGYCTVVWVVSGNAIPVSRANGQVFTKQRSLVSEESLVPLNDPGDDAVDEMLKITGPAPVDIHYLAELGWAHAVKL